MENQITQKVLNPSCSLMIYKPELSDKVLKALNKDSYEYKKHLTCCKDEKGLPSGTQIITVCAGCQQRFGSLSDDTSSISLWEILAKSKTFKFPDYKGKKMAIHDSCWYIDTKSQEAVRELLKKMNIIVLEPKHTRKKTACCGLNTIDKLPLKGIEAAAKKRADEMPVDDVAVYCVTGANYINMGGKKAHYILDLLFEEKTDLPEFEPYNWREKQSGYRKSVRKS